MDQSGPRHHAKVIPLIIDRPDLAHPLRRIAAKVFTALIWCWWLSLWIPAFQIVATDFGWAPAFNLQPTDASRDALNYLLIQFPVAILLLLTLLAVNFFLNALYQRVYPASRPHRQFGTNNLDAIIDPASLIQWQSARILRVDHNRLGQVVNATVVDAQKNI